MSIEAMKQALEDFRRIRHHFDTDEYGWEVADKAITALRTAIEQAEKQVPFMWVHPNWPNYTGHTSPVTTYMVNGWKPLYTTPPGGRQSEDCLTAAQRQGSDEADELLVNLGLDPQAYRTDGGAINYLKVKAAIRHPEDYPIKREHITDGSPCWCNPETYYVDPETGAAVIVHKEPQ